MTGRRVNRKEWPVNGDYLKLLQVFDRVHYENGLKSLREIASAAHVSHSTINQILTGRRLPADENQVTALIAALGGSAEDATKAELLYPRARRNLNPPERRDSVSGAKRAEAQVAAEEYGDTTKLDHLLRYSMDLMDSIASNYPKLSHAVPTGLSDLDALTGGFRAGQLTIVAGLSAVGKSTLGLNFVMAAAKSGHPSLYLGLESEKSQAVMSIIAAEARLRKIDMRAGTMSDDDWTRLARRMMEIVDEPAYIEDTIPTSMADFEQYIREARSSKNIELLVLDYAELVAVATQDRVEENLEPFMLQLKLLARDLKMSVVAIVSQWKTDGLSLTESYKRSPNLDDVGSPGTLRHADVVMILHRPDLHERDHSRAGEADIIVAKNRNGRPAIVTVANQLHYGRFADMAIIPMAP
ncbi:MAG: AAA family ATPase [Actinobacteria bacterium]|nr:AAA family ATPase [Actinomycetota bacterium]